MNNIRHTKIQLSKTYESMGGEELEEDAASMLNQLQGKLNKDLDELAHNFAPRIDHHGVAVRHVAALGAGRRAQHGETLRVESTRPSEQRPA